MVLSNLNVKYNKVYLYIHNLTTHLCLSALYASGLSESGEERPTLREKSL